MHILCIWYGTVQANTAVLSMHVRIVCLHTCSAPCFCKEYFSLPSVVSYAFSAICVYSKFRHHHHPAYLMPREPKLVLRIMYCITKTAEATPRHILSNDLKFTIYVALCQISAIPRRMKTVLWHFNTSKWHSSSGTAQKLNNINVRCIQSWANDSEKMKPWEFSHHGCFCHT